MDTRRILFYLIYFASALAFMAVWCFPGETGARYLSREINRRMPALTVTALEARPCLPPGVYLDQCRLAFGRLPKMDIDRARIRFPLSGLTGSGSRIMFDGGLAGGAVSGRLDTGEDTRELETGLDGLKMAGISWQGPAARADISGILDGSFTLAAEGPGWTGTARLVIRDVQAGMKGKVFSAMGVSAFAFPALTLELEKTGPDKLRITSLSGDGDKVHLKLRGELTGENGFTGDPGQWRIRLQGLIQPRPGFVPVLAKAVSKGAMAARGKEIGIPVAVSGTLAELGVRL